MTHIGLAMRRCYDLALSSVLPSPFPGSAEYWEQRYAAGGDSGVGSYEQFAQFKADVINAFVSTHGVGTVMEFGCGDGNQLLLARYDSYLGFDVSPTAVSRCTEMFANDRHKRFRLASAYDGEQAALTMSLDVIYHLIEDDVYHDYMTTLFSASHQYVIVYSSNVDHRRRRDGHHVRHREFTRWVKTHAPNWLLVTHLPNRFPYQGDYLKGSFAEFYIFHRNDHPVTAA